MDIPPQIPEETIAAVSTPFWRGGHRGPARQRPARHCHRGGDFPRAHAGGGTAGAAATIRANRRRRQVLDEVLLSVHRAPASYTGEDVIEIQCHGGILVTRAHSRSPARTGARAAEPGEFTRRAFLNGKMDLTQAEAVMDLIRAQTDLALRAATEQLEGRLGRHIVALREALLGILAHVEAHIDFPDEDIDPATGAALLARIDSVRGEVARLLRTAGQGRILREGLRTVIFGEPNAGKSSLLNRPPRLRARHRQPSPRTTRDTLEEVVNLRGIPVRLIDTAGVRPLAGPPGKRGHQRTAKSSPARPCPAVADASRPPGASSISPHPAARTYWS